MLMPLTPSRGTPAILAVVQLVFDKVHAVMSNRAAHLALEGTVQGTLHHGEQCLGGPLNGLEEHIARKAIADHDIGCMPKDVFGFDIPNKPCQLCPEQLVCLNHSCRAFFLLLADIQNAHRWQLFPCEHPTVHLPHAGKLKDVLRGTVSKQLLYQSHSMGLRTMLEPPLSSPGEGPANAPEDDQRNCHLRAGTAGRHDCLALAISDKLDGLVQRRVSMGPEHLRRVVMKRDHLRRGDHFIVKSLAPILSQFLRDGWLISDEDSGHPELAGSLNTTPDNLMGA